MDRGQSAVHFVLYKCSTKVNTMDELDVWSVVKSIAEVVGTVAIPVLTWVIYTLVQQGKAIIVLEQKVNESLNQRLSRVETRIANVEEKMDNIVETVVQCRIVANDTNNINKRINSQLEDLSKKIDNL
jgi:uncharacterized coiled-coil protein SlyX